MILLLLPALASIASWVLDIASRGGRNGLLKLPAPSSLARSTHLWMCTIMMSRARPASRPSAHSATGDKIP